MAEGGGLSLPWGLLRMQRFVPGGSVYFGLHVSKNNTTDLTKKKNAWLIVSLFGVRQLKITYDTRGENLLHT